MAIQIVTQKIGDSTTAEDINRLHLELSRKRVFTMTPNSEINLWCHTDNPEGLHEDIKVIKLTPRDDITDNKFYNTEFFDKWTEDKIVLWDANLQPLDLCQTLVIKGFPQKGDHKEAMDYIPDMDLELGMKIKNEMYSFIQMPTKWWDTDVEGDSGLTDWFIAFWASDCSDLKQVFEKDPKSAQETDFATFIKKNHKGIILPTEPGVFAPYYVSDKERTDALNEVFEQNVRPYFPDAWTGYGGEEEAPFLEWEHEYRDISKQVNFLYLDTDKGAKRPEEDWYLKLWFL
jgi:hypothetical protein